MTPVNSSELAVERRLGPSIYRHWATATADRRMIMLWIGWTSLSSILFIVSAYVGLNFAATLAVGLVQHSVFALAATAALVKPQTARSLAGPVLLYILWSLTTILTAEIQFAVSESQFSLSLSNIIASHVASFGSWIWFGVMLYVVAQFFGIGVSRQPYSDEGLTINKLLVATSLAATGFAMQRFGRMEQQLWVLPDDAQLVFVLGTALPVAVWFVVLWTQLCSYKSALFLIVLTMIGGVCISEFLHAAVWSRMELKGANAMLGHPALWEVTLSWFASMLGVWVIIRIAEVGGYLVRRTSAPSAADNETKT
jgi:hypothetical protein